MSKIKDYRLVVGDREELEREVKQLIKIGWEPFGSLSEDFVINDIKTPWYKRDEESVVTFFVQPMVLRVG